jgi:undecaprenyl-diphosphatase
MNWFDVHILMFLNQFAGHWQWLDFVVTKVYTNNLIGGGTITVLAWYALFDRKEEGQPCKRHELLLGAILLGAVSVVAARGLALSLPFRARPIWTPALHFRLPQGADLVLLGWSAFPSDHAALFFALATGIFFVSRPLGWLAVGWVAIFISLPALYLGVHWPTDVIVGACLGVSIAHVAKIPAVREVVRQFTTRWHRQQPGLFFAALFLWSYEIVRLFEDIRRVLQGLWYLRHLI